MHGFTKVTDTLLLSLLWLVFSIPVVTVGASCSGLYYAYHKAVRQDGGHVFQYFWEAFQSNFKRSTVIWLSLLAFEALSLFTCLMLVLMRQQLPIAGVFGAMGGVIVCVALVWGIYALAYQARFENSLKAVMKNSALLVVTNAPKSLLLLILFGAAAVLTVYRPVLIVVAVAVYACLTNFILESVFRNIMTKEDLQTELER